MIPESKLIEIRKYLSDNDIKLFREIEKRDDTLTEFLNTVNEIKWFYPFKILGFFNPKMIPMPQESEKGMFSIPEWNILTYLEKISNNTSIGEDIIFEIINIFENTTNYHINNKNLVEGYNFKTTDNYRTWWFFIKVLANIPNRYITLKILKYLEVWLASTFDTTLQTSEITNKIIPKFLNDDSTEEDIAKFEFVFELLIRFKERSIPEEYGKLLGNNKEYEFQLDFYWLKELFEKDSFIRLFGEKASINIYLKIIQSLKVLLKGDLLKSSLELNERNFLIEINQANHISINIYEYEADKEKSSMQMQLDGQKQLKLLGHLEFSNLIYVEFINTVSTEFKNLNILKINDERLNIYTNYLFSIIVNKECYHSLYDQRDYYLYEPFMLISELFVKTLLTKTNSALSINVENSKNLLNLLFREEFLFFKKCALYLISESNNDYVNTFFENMIYPDVNYIIFENLYFGDELNHLFNKWKSIEFDKITLLHSLIDRGSQVSVFTQNAEMNTMIWKQTLYKSLSHSEFFNSLYQSLKQITGVDYSLRATLHHTNFAFGSEEEIGKCNYSKDEILLLNNIEIVEILKKLRNNEFGKEFSVGAFLRVFSEIIKEYPQKITENFDVYIESESNVIYNIFSNLIEAWGNKKSLDWDSVFSFIVKFYENVDWQQELKKDYDPSRIGSKMILDSMIRLIDSGVKNDGWSMNQTDIGSSIKIFDKLFSLFEFLKDEQKDNNFDDYLTISLNTLTGRTLIAFILTLRRIAILKDTEKKDFLNQQIKKYESLLGNKYLEAYAVFGGYINIFDYIDPHWVKKQINSIYRLNKGDNLLWKAFIDGYFWNGRVYLPIYKEMAKNYELILSDEKKSDHVMKGLVNHLCLGYSEGMEDLSTNSLFGKLINTIDYDILKRVINQFWILRHGIVMKVYDESIPELKSIQDKRDRIIKFIFWFYEKFKNEKYSDSLKETKMLISDFSKLSTYLYDAKSENFVILKFAAPFIFSNFSSPYFIEALDEIKTDEIEIAYNISEIYLEILNIDIPRYDAKHINSIIDFLNLYEDNRIKVNTSKIIDKYLKYHKNVIKSLL